MTIRLSIRSFAGTALTLVAVGISKLASMFATIRAAGPRRIEVSSASSDAGDLAAGFAGGFAADVDAVAAAVAPVAGLVATGGPTGGGVAGVGVDESGAGIRSLGL